MCECDNICFYHKILLTHNQTLNKMLHKYINLIESYICTLAEIMSYGNMQINYDVIKVPDELHCLVMNLVPIKCARNPRDPECKNCRCSCFYYMLNKNCGAFYIFDLTSCENNLDDLDDLYTSDECDHGHNNHILCESDNCYAHKHINCKNSDHVCMHDKTKHCKCKLKYISLACLAKYQNENCDTEYLGPCDILYDHTELKTIDNMRRKISQYIGFKHFFETVIDLTIC